MSDAYAAPGEDLSPAGIFLTNAVTLDATDTTEVYKKYARLNHSCIPNARPIVVDGLRGVFAIEEIPAGAEIFVSYMEDENCFPPDRLEGAAATLDVSTQHVYISRIKFVCSVQSHCRRSRKHNGILSQK